MNPSAPDPSESPRRPAPDAGNGPVLPAMGDARAAQSRWSGLPVAARLEVIRRFRIQLARRAGESAEILARARNRPPLEVLTAEVLPTLAAARFLEREAVSLLAPRRLSGRDRPWWLGGVRHEVHRDPCGLVLILGPGNYPYFLPAVQALQALAAGNAVWLKPGLGGAVSARLLEHQCTDAGLPEGLFSVLDSDTATATAAVRAGVDKVLLTGSARSGEQVLAALAPQLVPATMELSGCDPVLVREDADLGLVTRALTFGTSLNGGATCVAPRRVLVHRRVFEPLEALLQTAFRRMPSMRIPGNPMDPLPRWLSEAVAGGATVLAGRSLVDGTWEGPLLLSGLPSDARLLREDLFAPVLMLVPVENDAAALALAARSPYALGASVFGADPVAVHRLATQVRAGQVTVNDVIVPTADPRVPFGGRGRSGFGSTRGPEGLLELTVPRVISHGGGARRHLDAPVPGDFALVSALTAAVDGDGWRSWPVWRDLVRALRQRGRVAASAADPAREGNL